MDRRTFLSLSGLTGLSLLLPWGASSQARAADSTWGGPYFLHMHAGGGWDPTMLCDAKLTAGGTTPSYENKLVTAVGDVNGIAVPTATKDGKYLLRAGNDAVEDPMHFFQTVGARMLVINGVDTQTNNHDTGVQGFACGHNDIELPAFAALLAGQVAKERDVPLAFIAGGQYNRTGDLVGVSRFPGDKVPLLAEPFKGAAGEEKPLISDLATQRILTLRGERLTQLESQATLPRNKRTLKAYRDATRGGGAINLLKQVASNPAPSIDSFRDALPPDCRAYLTAPSGNGSTRFADLGAPLETTLRCFQAGLSVSATFSQGGFDTHGQHDANQASAMGQFLARIRYVLLRAEQLGLQDKLTLLVTSDFGRTPRYNVGNGKDHWNVTSALVSGPGIRGGRVIGKTDEGHKALRVSASDASKTLADSDSGGVRIHPGNIHRDLRTVMGLDSAPFINQFQLPVADKSLKLLG
jgi:hypothetical protein